MHPPSPQLLHALRTSISTTNITNRLCANTRSASPISRVTLFLQSHRKNSSNVRPIRMIPRAHTAKPASHDRGPQSTEDTQTDFAALNVLGNIPAPTTAIDACLDNGFHLDNGLKLTNGDGLLLVGGEAFSWRPWRAADGDKNAMVNKKGQFEVEEQAWGLLDLVWPRPDLLIIGMGASVFPLSPETRKHINSLGVRVEVLDTRNAAAQFNLLATERGVSEIAAAMIPIGWKGR
ncbi:hypothetical protein ETB97_008140 [Aspergillus alliaceus]|uniref:NADH dehydrogenase [ubiquinone] 1 alpha subcomplex assembly factor 3 n=2 Tax=Petromyces alliaceus TaxID=209559 RepID=A0A5N6FGS2_PETAA|nr:uncharacterized protein BDW43DRAFT_289333 [Aspergillus alliaceus]KAB8229108.1 hypothetical protein BDW43DRAFT_289333 [Aspergillus alliaceus]KAE8394068.1 hypothetical protein BDV23DRAFT_148608 [Aspergillus alliaceus]KAF5855956.1 hypothetical protein ETB97_008140 [Aspergillus burnettii]